MIRPPLLSTLDPIVIPPPAGTNLNGWTDNADGNYTFSEPAHDHEVQISWEFADAEIYSTPDYGTASATYTYAYSDATPDLTLTFDLDADGDISSYDPPSAGLVQTITIALVADGVAQPVFTVARP